MVLEYSELRNREAKGVCGCRLFGVSKEGIGNI